MHFQKFYPSRSYRMHVRPALITCINFVQAPTTCTVSVRALHCTEVLGLIQSTDGPKKKIYSRAYVLYVNRKACVDSRPSDHSVRRWPLLLSSAGRYPS